MTYHLATILHDWHTIVLYDSSRSSKVSDFRVIWKPIWDFLLVIKSNLSPIAHRLATKHSWLTDDDDKRTDGRTTTAPSARSFPWLEDENMVRYKGVEKTKYKQARREPQRGPGKHSRGAPNIFTGSLWRENFWIFFQNGTLWRRPTLYFWPTAGLPNVAGPEVELPHPLDGRECKRFPWRTSG